MEISPVKEAKPPKYPRMDEVSPEKIKEAVPRRWMANRTAKEALAALTGSAFAVCVPEARVNGALPLAAVNINLLVDGQEIIVAAPSAMLEDTVGPMTEAATFSFEPLPGVAMPPPLPIWPYFIAAGFVLGIIIWIRLRIKKRKRLNEGTGKIQPAESVTEIEEEEDEY